MPPVRVLRTVVVTTLAALAIALVPAAPGHAVPDPATVEAQINAEWQKLEPVIEQHNDVRATLNEHRSKAAALQAQLQPLQVQVDTAMSKVSDIAVGVYKGGPAGPFNAVLTSDSPAAFAEQLTLLNMVARGQRDQIENVNVARDRYAGDKAALDKLIADQERQEADLAAKKKDIEEQIAKLQKLRQEAYGGSGRPPGGNGSLRPTNCPVEHIDGSAGAAIAKACSLIGTPYVYGGATAKGTDCSGLTMQAWAAAGINLPHSSQQQWSKTKRISAADRRPGDLVFFSGLNHVGIYVGGDYMVHAPTFNDNVRMALISSQGTGVAGYGRL